MKLTINDFKKVKEDARECETLANRIIEDAYEVALHGECFYHAELATSDVCKAEMVEKILIDFGFKVDMLEWNFDNRPTVFEIRLKW